MKKYKEFIDFYSWKNPIDEIASDGQQKIRLPHIKYFVATPNPNSQNPDEASVNVGAYTGKIHYNNLVQLFLGIRQHVGIETEPEGENEGGQIIKIDSQEKMQKCFNGKHLFCFFVLVNENIKGDEDKQLLDYKEISKLDRLRQKYSEDVYFYGYIDMICHSYLAQYVDVDLDSMPQLLVIYPNKM